MLSIWRSEADRWIRHDDRDRLQMACTRLLDTLTELERVRAELATARNAEALIRRVRCYAVVDPGGDPKALGAARMLGIERDIDDHCEGRPPRHPYD
jgi:hypothetical protein